MKKKLQELIDSEIKILSERKTEDGSMMILAPWIQAGRKNKNGRLYPLSLLQREVDRVQSSIKKGGFLGTGDHPASGLVDVATASHIPQKVWLDKDGKGWLETKIVPTSRGKNIQTLIKNGASLGLSARGFGEVGKGGVVQSDYKLVGIDIVTSPSEPQAVFSKDNVYESVNFDEDDESIEDKEQAMYELLQASYGRALDGGFEGDFDFYCELHEPGMRKVMHLPESDGKISAQKLTEEQVNKRIYSYYQEAVQGGFIGSIDEWKEKFPQLVEQASEKVALSEEKKEPKEKFKAKITWQEARASGFTGTIQEYREAYPDIELILPAPPSKPVIETLDEEATRIFKKLKEGTPNSSVTLESIKRMLGKEEEEKVDKRIRRRAIINVSRDLDGSVSQTTVERMVAEEVKALKEERRKIRERNWEAYEKLLS